MLALRRGANQEAIEKRKEIERQEKETIGQVFVRYCQSGAGMLDRWEMLEAELKKEPGFSEVQIKPIYRDANRGPRSRTFFEDPMKTKARVNYWRVILPDRSYLLPEPKTPTRFSDLDLDAIFPSKNDEQGKAERAKPSTISEFLPASLKQSPRQVEEKVWEAIPLESLSENSES